VQVQRQARRALLASVLAVPVVVATRPAQADEEGLGEVKDLDFRALILSTILMGVAGFTAVGAASTPGALRPAPCTGSSHPLFLL
jgi:hypothetical protein